MKSQTRSLLRMAVALLLATAIPGVVFAEDAAVLFKSRCAACHGADGSGNTPMGKKIGAKALGSAEVQKKSDADLQKVITAGNGKMPAFGTKLSAAQITEVVKLVRGFAAK